MRTLLLAGAAALSLAALPTGLSAQQSADAANAANPPAPATTTVITQPAEPAETTVIATPDRTTVITEPAEPARTAIVTNNPGNLTAPPQAALNKSYPVCTRAPPSPGFWQLSCSARSATGRASPPANAANAAAEFQQPGQTKAARSDPGGLVACTIRGMSGRRGQAQQV